MLVGIGYTNGQIKPFKAISQFNGNVMNYLKYNVDERTDYYKGKTVAELLSDLNINPIGYMTIMQDCMDGPCKTGLSGIEIYFKHYDSDYSPMKDDYVTIYFENIISKDKFKELDQKFPSKTWVQRHYDFFKDMIIKNVYFNPYKESYLKIKKLPNK